jgi:apolipoprotein N-acyltransferase
MSKTPGRPRGQFPLILLVVGMIMFVFSNGRWIIPFAAWLAPVFLLRFTRLQRARFGFPVLFVLIAVASRIMLFGIIPSLLGVLTYVLTLYYAILWFLPYLADRLIKPKLTGFIQTLVFPTAGVAAEYVNNLLYGSWASVAYTQFDHLALIQICSITGIWGVTFIVMWFASTANWIMERGLNWPSIRKGVVTFAATLSFVLIYGGLRLGIFPPSADIVVIASFTPTQELESYSMELENRGFSSSIHMAREDRASLSDLLDNLHNKIFEYNISLLNRDASLVLWPESAIRVLEENETDFLKRGRDLALEKEVYLLLAYFVIPKEDPARSGENKSVLINPEGNVEWEYLKAYPVPGSTDKAGDGVLPVTNTPFGKISSSICYDMDFTSLIYHAGKEHVDIMLVPAWDWEAIDPLHTRMAVFRAIENGFSMVRQTGEGLSIAVDYNGRTLASMDHFTTDDHAMISQIPVKGIRTIYAITGDLFAWLCCAGLVFLLGWGLIKKD